MLFRSQRGDSPKAIELYNDLIAHIHSPQVYRRLRIEKADLLVEAGRKLEAYQLYQDLYHESRLTDKGTTWVRDQIKVLGTELGLPRYPVQR